MGKARKTTTPEGAGGHSLVAKVAAIRVPRAGGGTTRVEVTWEQCDPLCPGWGHFEAGHGNEVEACMECRRFVTSSGEADDAAAQRAHKVECGCNWGEKACANPKCLAGVLVVRTNVIRVFLVKIGM